MPTRVIASFTSDVQKNCAWAISLHFVNTDGSDFDLSAGTLTGQVRSAPAVQLPLATATSPGAMSAARDLNIVCIGDSHTVGKIQTTKDSADYNFNPFERMLCEPPMRDWTGTADGASPRLINAIGDNSHATDPNTLGISGALGSWTAWLPAAIRRASVFQTRYIRIANLGNGGASVYTWAGQQAWAYFNFTGVPSDGDTVSVGGVTYRFKSTPAQAYDVQIGDQGVTAQNLGFAING